MKHALQRPDPAAPARLAAVLAALWLGALPAAHAATCPPLCVTRDSVKNAAGIDPKLFAALSFARGEAAISASVPAVLRVAQAWKAAGGKGVVGLKVAADSGLHGAAASAQTKARASALAGALVEAGIPAANVHVVAR